MAEAVAARRVGPERLLVGAYVVFVVAALGRSSVQLATHPGRAPLAYALSVAAAAGYVVGLALLVRVTRGGGPRAARVWCAIELAGVLAVGTWTVVRPRSFPDATVWSYYGAGYLFVPLILPVLAWRWLRRGS